MNDIKFAALLYAQIEVNRPRAGTFPPSHTIFNLLSIPDSQWPDSMSTVPEELDRFIHLGEQADWMVFSPDIPKGSWIRVGDYLGRRQ